jgi:glycosyltransferase involved in cell wall biosynthesis
LILPAAPLPVLSIVIPNYRTEEFTRLCLRSLRKYSRLPNEVIVVDNNSADDSTEYLRSLKWIRLVENNSQSLGSLAHREALDLGAQSASGQWLMLMHSDAIVLKEGWDCELIAMAEAAGAVGFSTVFRKLDRFEPWWSWWATKLKDGLRRSRTPAGSTKLMSHCFAIRRDVIPWNEFSFRKAGDPVTDLYDRFVRDQHPFLLLDRATLEQLMWHPSNVTSIVTSQMAGNKLVSRFQARAERLKRVPAIRAIIEDESLDR